MGDEAMHDRRGHVLVVDDDAAVCWAIEQALLGEGYRVRVAADAAAARRLLARERPDVMICDVRMPGESGLDLLADVHARHRELPVIVMTNHLLWSLPQSRQTPPSRPATRTASVYDVTSAFSYFVLSAS